MLKACTLFKFRADWDPAVAQKYWRTSHGDVLRSYPFYKRYAQSHPILSDGVNTSLPYDGFAEVWVESTQVLREAAAGPGYQSIVDDETKFIDRTHTDLVLSEDTAIIDHGVNENDVKLVHLIKRKQKSDPAAYHQAWIEKFANNMVGERSPRKLIVSNAKLSGYRGDREPKWDVIVTEWQGADAALPDQGKVSAQDIDADQVVTMRTKEYVIAEF